MFAFMELIAIVDKSFRDLLRFIDPSVKLPNKLYDMLKMREFYQLISNDDILLTWNILVGTQDGLNLRNLLWHGFLNKSQFDPAFTSFLMFCVVSMKPPEDRLLKKMSTREEAFPPKDFRPYAHMLNFGLGANVLPGIISVYILYLYE
jgi:hypothetical protein